MKLGEHILADGTRLEVVRIILPDDLALVQPWMLAEAQRDLPFPWHVYYADAFAGCNPRCRDFLYWGIADGVVAGRMWFGYSTRSNIGNFGNVQTLPEYRRRGIMSTLLTYFRADFEECAAVSVSCDAADSAAPAYESVGFKRIFTPDRPPMALVKSRFGSFNELNARLYAPGQTCIVRDGVVSDRFDCDKMLAYSPELYLRPRPAGVFPDYLSLWAARKQSPFPVQVFELASGAVAGYAYSYGGKTYCVKSIDNGQWTIDN